jgi:small nuclear ribonucleoprotein (snRNP)-like protein
MNYIGKKVIVRCNNAGVFFGTLKEYDNVSREAVLGDVRCVHYWERAAGLAQVAMDGVGSNSRLTMVVPEMAVMDVIEIIPCSDKAIANLEGQKIWKI